MQKTQSTKRSRDAAMMAAFAALYAAGVTFLAPISFQVFQIRVVDALLPLSVLFGLPAIIGLTLGTLVGNFSSPFGAIDVVGGTVANFVATTLAWRIGKAKFEGAWLTATASEAIVITFIVGTYLAYLVQLPLWLSWTGVLIGEIIAINIGGYPLLRAVSRVKGRR